MIVRGATYVTTAGRTRQLRSARSFISGRRDSGGTNSKTLRSDIWMCKEGQVGIEPTSPMATGGVPPVVTTDA